MCTLDWRHVRIGTIKTFKYMFERLPGIGWRYWSWKQPVALRPGQPVADADVGCQQSKIRMAIQFLKDEAPRGNFDCEQILWVECEMANPNSPLQDIRRETVSAVFKVLKDKDQVATKQLEYPLLFPDIRREYQDISPQSSRRCSQRPYS